MKNTCQEEVDDETIGESAKGKAQFPNAWQTTASIGAFVLVQGLCGLSQSPWGYGAFLLFVSFVLYHTQFARETR